MRDLAFAFVWMVLFPISFWSPHIGILLWIWTALLSPGEMLYGFMAAVPFNKVVAFTTVVALMVSPEKKRFYMNRVLWFVALLGVDIILVYFFSPYTTSGDFLVDKVSKVLVLVALFSGIMWSRHRLVMACWAIALSYGLIFGKEALQYLVTAGGHKVFGTGSTGDNNGVAMAAIMSVPLMIYLAQTSAVRVVRLGAWTAAALSATCVIATNSRGGLLGLCAIGLLLIGKSRHKVGASIAVAMFAALLLSVAPQEWFDRINTINTADEDSSTLGRIVAWKISLTMAMDHPFGSGLFAILSPANWYGYGAKLDWLSFIPTPPAGPKSLVAHSIYFQILGDLGFFGLGLFLGMLAAAFLALRRVKRMARIHPELRWAGQLASMLELSLVGYCTAGAALSMCYFELMYIVVAMSARLLQTCVEILRGEPQYVQQAAPLYRPRAAPALTSGVVQRGR